MNQILVSEKLYVTPELKKKKKLYKFNFITSIFLVIILFSYYVYAEYDRNESDKSEEILVIHPPTGINLNILYLVIAVISLAILAAGVFGIRKFVIKK